MLTLRESDRDGLRQITLRNDELSVSLLPELGAKIISVFDRVHSREWMSIAPGATFRRAQFAEPYSALDNSGWDECFPAVGAGYHPTPPWAGTPIADHGEVFTLPWSVEPQGDSLKLSVSGVHFPYTFEKTLSLHGAILRTEYRVSNPTPFDFPCIWSTHPLFQPTPGMRIRLPEVTGNVTFAGTNQPDRFDTYGSSHTWPNMQTLEGELWDLSAVHSPNAGVAIKLFTRRLVEGWCALVDYDGWVAFRFDPKIIPFLGVWINQGLPRGESDRYYHVALEPTTGRSDWLDAAMRADTVSVIPAHDELRWTLDLGVGGDNEALDQFVAQQI